MITLLGSLLGFLASFAPQLLKLFTEKADRQHELDVMDKQIEIQKLGINQHLEEVRINADAALNVAVHQPMQLTGIRWIDGLNGSVRPILTYCFFALYAVIKIFLLFNIDSSIIETPWLYWTDEDQIIFASIISFHFGARSIRKVCGR